MPAAAGFPGLELLATGVLMLGADERVLYANPAAENLFELSRNKLLGNTPAKLFGDAAPLAAAIARATASRTSYTEQDIELGAVGKTRMRLACTVSPIDFGGAAFLVEFRHIDRQLRIAREERLQEQQQANRDLVRSLAHEIKNPLGGIRGAAQLLERELAQPRLAAQLSEPLTEYTQVIIDEADRLQALVSRLLTPSRLPNHRRTNVHEILIRARNVVQAEFPAIRFELEFDTSIPEFDADPDQLAQAVLNIVKNAAEAVATGTPLPQIVLGTHVVRGVTLARKRHRLGLAVSVRDNGPGIPEAIRERVFYPLVSGREGGSGLGLTIAQTLVAQHHGAIEWTSEPGKTIFTIMLPLGVPPSAAADTRHEVPAP
ncbi:MAG: PAS domain-containing protein [Burkholderiales bacterium]|nr:PAS domain-containing protein [Burkholderiales bacterium]